MKSQQLGQLGGKLKQYFLSAFFDERQQNSSLSAPEAFRQKLRFAGGGKNC
jgi:hypothetical protein